MQNGATRTVRFIVDDEARKAGSGCFENEGTIAELQDIIANYQSRGYGVFYVANEAGPATGKNGFTCDDDVTNVRAIFADFDDGIPNTWHARPPIIVKTSYVNGVQRGQALWPVAGMSVADFRQTQRRLAAHYGSDVAVINPSRVLRLPGTLHLKNPANPQLVNLVF